MRETIWTPPPAGGARPGEKEMNVMTADHLSEETILLYSMRLDLPKAAERRGGVGRNPALHTPGETAAIRQHLHGCPDCLLRLDRYLMLDFPMPGEPLWEAVGGAKAGEADLQARPGVTPLPLRGVRGGLPLRAAASPAEGAVVTDPHETQRAEPFATAGGIAIGRYAGQPTRFIVYRYEYAGRTLCLIAAGEEPIACEVDCFLRFELSEAEAARFEQLIEGGAEFTVALV